jgi:trehalose 6-phosphate phosphatase
VTYLFGLRAEARARQSVAAGLLLAFDFDGTLAPIVPDRHRAAMRPETRRLFTLLCARTACAVVSGRTRRDVRRRLHPARPLRVIGAHGADGGPRWQPRGPSRPPAERIRAAIARLPGVAVERAGPSVAVHYRHSPHPLLARAAILDAVSSLGAGYRALEGKRVVNVLPADAPDKGGALRGLLQATGRPGALFVGDDRTDEDAFDAVGERGLAIRVGTSRGSRATYFIRSQDEVDRLLRLALEVAG